MKAHQAGHDVRAMSRVLGVSPSGFYAWCRRGPWARARRDAALLAQIRASHRASRAIYGAPRIMRDLRDAGERVGQKRVARLLRGVGLQGVSRRRTWRRTTVRDPHARPAPDLVQRQFRASRRDAVWVADITYVPTATRVLYVAVVLDVWSPRVVGWAMAEHLRVELVLAALEMAVQQRRPTSVIHHSDQGCQYTAIAFGARCREAGVRPSMGSVGDCYDNALCESFFATLECELLARNRWSNPAHARQAIFDFIEGWYNTKRRHSSIGYLSPVAFEHAQEIARTTEGAGTDAQSASLPA
jgi:transposase InsO family protein